MDEQRFREAFQDIVDGAPRPPRWETLSTPGSPAWRDFFRRPVIAFLAGAVFVLVTIGVTALVGGNATPPAAGSSTTTMTTDTTVPGTTTDTTENSMPGVEISQMACGRVVAEYSQVIPQGSELTLEAQDALAALKENAEGRSFADSHEFRLWSQTNDELILLGYPTTPSETGYADARFELRDGHWAPTGWGGCSWQPVTDGYGIATWRPSGDIDPAALTVTVLATERNCANGQAPTSREVTDLSIADGTTVTIFVLVEPVQGDATCPSNPEFEYEITLDAPVGDRALLDGSTVPPEKRATTRSASGCPDRQVTDENGDYLNIVLACGNGALDFRIVSRPLGDNADVSVERLLGEILRGPTAEETADGYVSFFGAASADALESVDIAGTHATLDFNDRIVVNNANTATGSIIFQAELLYNVFQMHEVDTVEFRIDGSCEAWSNLLQDTGCRIYTRDDLTRLLDAVG